MRRNLIGVGAFVIVAASVAFLTAWKPGRKQRQENPVLFDERNYQQTPLSVPKRFHLQVRTLFRHAARSRPTKHSNQNWYDFARQLLRWTNGTLRRVNAKLLSQLLPKQSNTEAVCLLLESAIYELPPSSAFLAKAGYRPGEILAVALVRLEDEYQFQTERPSIYGKINYTVYCRGKPHLSVAEDIARLFHGHECQNVLGDFLLRCHNPIVVAGILEFITNHPAKEYAGPLIRASYRPMIVFGTLRYSLHSPYGLHRGLTGVYWRMKIAELALAALRFCLLNEPEGIAVCSALRMDIEHLRSRRYFSDEELRSLPVKWRRLLISARKACRNFLGQW